jgi:hypothetical protein
LSCFNAFAQKKEIDFGKPLPEEIALKVYEKEKSAGAVVLYDYTKISFEYEYSQAKYVIEKLVRIKILNSNGLENGNVSIPFIGSSSFEDVEKIKGVTINTEGDKLITSEISKSNIYKSKEKNTISTVKIAFPNVKPGSIIDYQYKITRETLFSIPTVYLQQDIPVIKEQVVFDLPEFLQTKKEFIGISKEVKSEEITDKYISFSSGGREQFKSFSTLYEYKDILPLKNEEYMFGTMRNHWKRIESSVTGIAFPGERAEYFKDTWGMVGGMMRRNKYFWGQITKGISPKEPENKVKYLCEYVKSNFSWNSEYTLTGKDVSKVLETKTGSNGELNLLLVNLLRHAGLECYPVLCSTNDYGIVNESNPDINEFNCTMTLVQLKDKILVIDAAEKYEPYDLLPKKIISNSVYIIGEKSGRFLRIWDNSRKQKQNIAINIIVDDKGNLEGTAFLKSYDYERSQRLTKYKSDKTGFEKEYYKHEPPGFIIKEIETSPTDIETDVFEQKATFQYKPSQTGGYYYFNPNLLLNFGSNPFSAATRRTGINFQTNVFKKLFVKVNLPENFSFEGLPENKKIINPDTSISLERIITATDNELFYTLKLEINKPIFGTDEYAQLKEIFRTLYALLDEQIVLKKKN